MMSISWLLKHSAEVSNKLADELLIERTHLEVAEALLSMSHFQTGAAVERALEYMANERPLKELVEATAPFYRKNVRDKDDRE